MKFFKIFGHKNIKGLYVGHKGAGSWKVEMRKLLNGERVPQNEEDPIKMG